MKVALVVLAVAVAVSAGPVVRAINWGAVADKVEEIHGLVESTLDQIIVIAKGDSADVGAEIEAIIDGHKPSALAIFERANELIQNQELTEDGAKLIFDQLLELLAVVRADLEDSVASLSEAAAAEILGHLNSALTRGEALAEELYALLRE